MAAGWVYRYGCVAKHYAAYVYIIFFGNFTMSHRFATHNSIHANKFTQLNTKKSYMYIVYTKFITDFLNCIFFTAYRRHISYNTECVAHVKL